MCITRQGEFTWTGVLGIVQDFVTQEHPEIYVKTGNNEHKESQTEENRRALKPKCQDLLPYSCVSFSTISLACLERKPILLHGYIQKSPQLTLFMPQIIQCAIQLSNFSYS